MRILNLGGNDRKWLNSNIKSSTQWWDFFFTFCSFFQSVSLTQPIQQYILCTFLLVNFTLINHQGGPTVANPLKVFLFDWEALNGTTVQVFWRVSWKGQWRFDDVLLLWRENRLTALVALDHDVFDGQQATLPWGYGFKHNLRRRKETHNTGDERARVFKRHLSADEVRVRLSLTLSAPSWGCSWWHSCRPLTLFPQYVTDDRCYDMQVLN